MPLLEGPECNSSAAACLEVMDKPLIIYNIDVVNRALKGKVTAVAIPSHLKRAFDLINEQYKNINIKEVNDDASINYTNNNSYGIIDWSDESIRLPINSVIRSLPTGLDTNSGNIQVDVIRYPWNFLAAVHLFFFPYQLNL